VKGSGGSSAQKRQAWWIIIHTEDGGRLGDGEREELGDLLVGQRDPCRLLLGRRLLRRGVGSHGKERVVGLARRAHKDLKREATNRRRGGGRSGGGTGKQGDPTATATGPAALTPLDRSVARCVSDFLWISGKGSRTATWALFIPFPQGCQEGVCIRDWARPKAQIPKSSGREAGQVISTQTQVININKPITKLYMSMKFLLAVQSYKNYYTIKMDHTNCSHELFQ